MAECIYKGTPGQANCGIKLNKEWARSVLRHISFTKRRANSKSKILPDDFEEIKEHSLTDVQSVIEMEEVPPSLVLKGRVTCKFFDL